MSELLPCPFCGSVPTDISTNGYIFCSECSANGPYTKGDARAAWNRRATPQAHEPDGAGEASNSQRCEHCDDTGDIIRLDGEWMGECHCGDGKSDGAQPVQEMYELAERIFNADRRVGHWAEWADLAEDDPTRQQFLLYARAALDGAKG